MFFERSFQDSSWVKEWPNSLSTIHHVDSHGGLRSGSHLAMTYKLGPLRSIAPYRIDSIVRESSLVYETMPDHPLHGRSEIRLTSLNHHTLCRWSGFYEVKSTRGYLLLAWFKIFFGRIFFGFIERKMKNLPSGRIVKLVA